MRRSVAVGRDGNAWVAVRGTFGVIGDGRYTGSLRTLVSDRTANGEAFDGEHVVRLPRRFARDGASYAHGHGPATRVS